MTAGEHHAQLVVPDFPAKSGFDVSTRLVDRQDGPLEKLLLFALNASSTKRIEGFVLGYSEKPRLGMVGNAVKRPGAECLNQGVLDDVFRQLEVFETKDPSEMRDHLPRLMAEQMVD